MKIWFYGQDEETDADGFYTNSLEAERNTLRTQGAPIEGLVLFTKEAEDRDSATVVADAPKAFRDWLDAEGIEWAFAL